MHLFIRYMSDPDEQLDENIVEIFESLGFQTTYSSYNNQRKVRDIWFKKEDPFDGLEEDATRH